MPPYRCRMIRLLQQTLILLAGVLLCTALANAQEAPAGEQHRIREIRFYIVDPYTEDQAKESSWASFVNRYHITTRESVIRTRLLFKEGDVLDEELLVASERSLRSFQFLNKSEVSVVPVDDRNVDVEVRSEDAWSLVPGMDLKGGGGLSTVSVHLMELNLLGYGKKLFAEARYESDVGTTMDFGYTDYQLFNSRWLGSANYKTGPLIDSLLILARKPLYSPDSKWSYGGSAYKADSINRLFENGEEFSRFAEEQIQLTGFVERSYGQRYKKINLKFSIDYKKADYFTLGSETTAPPPQDQANLTPAINLDTGYVSFEKYTYINKMGIVEDNWLGLRYGGKLGYGIPLENGFELWDTRLFIIKNTAFAHQQLLKLNAAVGSEVVRNTMVTATAKYYKKFSSHTVATHLTTRLGYELDTSRQFALGADSGLRGYPARQFTGDKLVLMNLEDRQFWGEISVGPKLAIGTILFVDAGNVWKRNEDIDLVGLNWSTGFGFRLGFSKFPHQPIFRIDCGWAIGGENSFAVTIGQEQQF